MTRAPSHRATAAGCCVLLASLALGTALQAAPPRPMPHPHPPAMNIHAPGGGGFHGGPPPAPHPPGPGPAPHPGPGPGPGPGPHPPGPGPGPHPPGPGPGPYPPGPHPGPPPPPPPPHWGWYDEPYWDHPVATAAAVGVVAGATAAVTAAALGSTVYALPTSCVTVFNGNLTYFHCGSAWYQPRYSGSSVTYIVVNPPY